MRDLQEHLSRCRLCIFRINETKQVFFYKSVKSMYFCFEDVDVYCFADRVKCVRVDMEKTISEHATNSADSSRVHFLLLKELNILRIYLGKKSGDLNKVAGEMRERCEKLRQVLNSSLHTLSHSCAQELIHLSSSSDINSQA